MPSWKCTRAWGLNHGLRCFFVALFGIFGACTNLSQCYRYVDLLGDPLRPFMLFCYPHGKGVFQQDNCTSHKSRLATEGLDEDSSDFSVIKWPPRSLDLNFIDHLWDVLEQGWEGHHTAPTNLTELWTG
ncbi:DDE_3 domain-containing protein [Trichonephila clavipes]|nr:DDE_3 domain-containing protein [Trichonephila clavipes]